MSKTLKCCTPWCLPTTAWLVISLALCLLIPLASLINPFATPLLIGIPTVPIMLTMIFYILCMSCYNTTATYLFFSPLLLLAGGAVGAMVLYDESKPEQERYKLREIIVGFAILYILYRMYFRYFK